MFDINKVFYPGSHVHIAPSLIFSNVCYADSFRNTHKFFEDKGTIDFIKKKKSMQGIAYTKSPSGYIFKKVSE